MVRCQVCGKEYKKITASHLQTHGITYNEYLKEYRPKEYFYKTAAELLERHYITVRRVWDILDKDGNYKRYKKGKRYNNGNVRKYGLSVSDLRNHTRGKKTVAVKNPKDRSKFIGLDIDLNYFDVLLDVYIALKSYAVPDNAIIMSSSGNKGYHVDIMLTDTLSFDEIEKFYKLIRLDTGYTKSEIELSGRSKSHKLPLGVNFKAKYADDEGYCYLCNEYGYRFTDEQALIKLQGIEPIEPSQIVDINEINEVELITDDQIKEFDSIVEDINLLESYKNPLESLVNGIESKGIDEAGKRHNRAFVLALGYRDKGFCSKEIYRKLIDWHKTLNPDFYNTSLEEAKPEYKRMSKDVFNSDYNLPLHDVKKRAFITKENIDKVLAVEKKGKGQRALRRLLFALIIHSLMYADKDGVFYMTYDQMNKLLGTNNPNQHFKDQLEYLDENGHIEIIRRNYRGKGLKHEPNKYKVPGASKERTENDFKICNYDKRCKDCINRAICHFYDDDQIKSRFSYRKAKAIIKAEPCPVN